MNNDVFSTFLQHVSFNFKKLSSFLTAVLTVLKYQDFVLWGVIVIYKQQYIEFHYELVC